MSVWYKHATVQSLRVLVGNVLVDHHLLFLLLLHRLVQLVLLLLLLRRLAAFQLVDLLLVLGRVSILQLHSPRSPLRFVLHEW